MADSITPRVELMDDDGAPLRAYTGPAPEVGEIVYVASKNVLPHGHANFMVRKRKWLVRPDGISIWVDMLRIDDGRPYGCLACDEREEDEADA